MEDKPVADLDFEFSFFAHVCRFFHPCKAGALLVFLPRPGTVLFSAAGHFIDGRPRATIRFSTRHSRNFNFDSTSRNYANEEYS
jgi:hypothetical protein